MGKTLGWVSEGTVEKLIYVAHVHDIRYFEKPFLARFRTRAEFNLKKHPMSDEESKMFLEKPSYAAGIAMEDESNSADVKKLLLQQKERSDGSGFPGGLRSPQFAPLSCLFILSHEFVDYVLTDPYWNTKEFVSQSRESFKGPYFLKILQIFSEMAEGSSLIL